MKITNADIIQSSEREFIDFINAELDWSAIEKIILEKHKLQLQDEVVYKQGDIVVYENQIAYQLDFDIKVSLSLILNRQGECLYIKTPDGQDLLENDDKESTHYDEDSQKTGEFNLNPDKSDSGANNHEGVHSNWSKMALNIAEMIHDINQDT